MQQIVSITSQGQVTIPAFVRRQLGLDKFPKASIKVEDEKIIIEPIPDLLSLGGKLQQKSIKKKNITQIMKLENETILKAVARKYRLRKK